MASWVSPRLTAAEIPFCAFEVRGFDHGLPRQTRPFRVLEILFHTIFRPVHRPTLSSIQLGLHVLDRLIGIMELLEFFRQFRTLDSLSPLVKERADQLFHLCF